jgi:Ala-tRNA(Pro) deacylase
MIAMPDSKPTTAATRADLYNLLDRLRIETTTTEHAAVFTVAESDQLERELPGAHTKNLFLKDAKGRLFLIIAQAHTAIHLKQLHKTLECARLSFGSAALLVEVLGVQPGSVTAFAVMNDRACRVSVVVDASLMNFDVVNCHPLINTATTAIKRDDLLAFIRATGHEPLVARLPFE